MDRQTYWETKLAWVITVLALALSGWWIGVFDWSAEPSRDISPRVFVYQVTGWDEQTRTWVMTCADGEG